MVSTAVLLTVVLAAFALIAGAFYALVHLLGRRIDDLGAHVGDCFTGLEARVGSMETEFRGEFRRMHEALTDIRTDLAGLDARVSTLERR